MAPDPRRRDVRETWVDSTWRGRLRHRHRTAADEHLGVFERAGHALPLDIVRVFVGLLTFAYFVRTFVEAPLFSAPEGLLDHALVRRMFPFTRMSLFPESISLTALRLSYACGCALSLLLAAGIGGPAVALVLYVLAVSTYRWNFVLMYVDDAVVHLALFWMVILPIGTTLTLPQLLGNPAAPWASWQSATVPGLSVRAFMANLALVYLVAGVWKWSSPMWRQGSALHAALLMPCSRAEWFRAPMLSSWLKAGNYAALVIEPLLPLLLVAPSGSMLKWGLLSAAIAFHGGILIAMKFPFANVAMLAGLVLFFAPELMAALGAKPLTEAAILPGPSDWLAVATVVTLALLFLLNAVWFRSGATTALGRRGPARGLNPLYVPLWVIGLAQSYRLFDWIDQRNYHVRYEVTAHEPGKAPRQIDPSAIFSRPTMRHVLLQSYLFGNLWISIDPRWLPSLRASILERYARRFCMANPDVRHVEVRAIVGRLTPDNLDMHRATRTNLVRFTNAGGRPLLGAIGADPPAST